jgi:hypothetical protein
VKRGKIKGMDSLSYMDKQALMSVLEEALTDYTTSKTCLGSP